MPTYDYRCAKCGEDLEVYQTFSEAPLTRHKGCGGKLAKVLSPAGIVLKGSGFYKTDNRSSNGGKRSSDGNGKDSGNSGSSSDSSKSSETKSESKSADSGGSGSGSSGSSDTKSSGSGSSGSGSSSDSKKPAAKSA